MPIAIYQNIGESISWGLWEITETKEELLSLAYLSEGEKREIEGIRNERKLVEALSGKVLVKSLAEKLRLSYSGLIKDDCSKPFLLDSKFHISLSHSYPYACAAINKSLPIGIDIEEPKEQVLKIRNKFLSDREIVMVEDSKEKACIFWSAKEALYKLHGRKKLIFKENLKVEIKKNTPQLEMEGEIICNNIHEKYSLYTFCHENFIIVVTGNAIN
jgi:4'-phosphopantetheinyl transferase